MARNWVALVPDQDVQMLNTAREQAVDTLANLNIGNSGAWRPIATNDYSS